MKNRGTGGTDTDGHGLAHNGWSAGRPYWVFSTGDVVNYFFEGLANEKEIFHRSVGKTGRLYAESGRKGIESDSRSDF